MNQAALEMLKKGGDELGVQLSPEQIEKLTLFARRLKEWNKKINLTAIKSDEDIAIKHFIDSLALAKYIEDDVSLLDIGSGAGFPSIPLKIVKPQLKVTSIDAVGKKIFFQRNIARLLSFGGFKAIHGRVEQLEPEDSEKFDIIVSRAFSSIPAYGRIAGPLLKDKGTIIAMKGKEGKVELEQSEKILGELGLVVRKCEEFCLPFSGDARCLIFMNHKIC